MEDLGGKAMACVLCGKNFPSMKSLCEHMRSHRHKEWRGIQPPSRDNINNILDDSIDILPNSTNHLISPSLPSWSVTGKRGRKSTTPHPKIQSHMDEYVFVEVPNPTNVAIFVTNTSNSYTCAGCNISFPTPQALGGHRSSHNKSKKLKTMNKSESETYATVTKDDGALCVNLSKANHNGHQCNLCNKTFPTGQALGGHMRRHWTPNKIANQDQDQAQSVQAKSPDEKTTQTCPRILNFDLNQLPAIDEDDVVFPDA